MPLVLDLPSATVAPFEIAKDPEIVTFDPWPTALNAPPVRTADPRMFKVPPLLAPFLTLPFVIVRLLIVSAE